MNAAVRTRTLRGAVCGMVAAATWALEQPLDKLLLDSSYDDVELLGKAVTRGNGWYPAGLAIHIGNGALFGAVYANVATYLPIPAMLRGPAVSMTEHLTLWPLGYLSDRLHPARKDLPTLHGNKRAFAQGVVRHLVFGVALGELERRLNATPETAPPPTSPNFSSNGHGSIERAISGERSA
ncbi:MAG: hypothetical protein ACJ764_14145 [Solirubrobacteraceae bacterium]